MLGRKGPGALGIVHNAPGSCDCANRARNCPFIIRINGNAESPALHQRTHKPILGSKHWSAIGSGPEENPAATDELVVEKKNDVCLGDLVIYTFIRNEALDLNDPN
jgi:hypothetical protein